VKFNATAYILFVKDMPRLTAFYGEAFGFKQLKNARYKETQWLELQAGKGFKLCLHKFPKPGSPSGNRNKLVFGVDDVSKARAALKGRGARLGDIKTYADVDHLDGRDPEGNAFQLVGPARGVKR
jgi:predicted enzyme related to lactoylglutathione lyase